MNIKASFLYAKKILFSHGSRRTTGSKSITGAIICIALSLIPLVVVISVSDGMIRGITERLINLSSSHLQLQYNFVGEQKINKSFLDDALLTVKNVEGVTSAYEMISSVGLASSKKGRCGATIRSCEPSVFTEIKSYSSLFTCVDGNIQDFGKSAQNVLIGQGIAEQLELKVGDTIRLITTQKINDRIFPKMTPFKVCAIISSGYQELDALWIFIPISRGIEILKPESSTVSIMIETVDPFDKNGSLRKIQAKVEDATSYLASTYRWDELNRAQYENFSSTETMLIFIMILIVLVATVNISSCIVMISLERKKEIAILKSFGTSSKTISMSFVIVGFMIGVLGVLIGIPIGILISLNVNNIIAIIEQIVNFFAKIGYFIANGSLEAFSSIELLNDAYYLESIPVEIPIFRILLYIVFTILLSIVMSLIPAHKAGKEKPNDIFRKVGA